MGIGGVGRTVSRSLYDRMLYNVACCHPERSEGSLIQRTNQSDSFTLIIVQRFFGQCPRNDRIIVCWHKNGRGFTPPCILFDFKVLNPDRLPE